MADQRSVLAALARAATPHLGGDASDVTRLKGGTSKGVYRVRRGRGPSVIVYRWHPDEDRWPSDGRRAGEDDHGPEGRDAFLAAHARLDAIALRVPALYADVGPERELHGNLVVVEDLGDRSLADALDAPWSGREGVFADFAAMVRRLHAEQRSRPGPVGVPDGTSATTACTDRIIERAERDLVAAAEHPVLRRIAPRLGALLDALAPQVRPRSRWTLLHGELGPDHVLVTSDGRPCLIDIEGLTYGDLEWEHAYLSLRLGPWYRQLHHVQLDPVRLELYTLAQHLSLVAGPMLILSHGPDPTFEQILAHNVARLADLAEAAADPHVRARER